MGALRGVNLGGWLVLEKWMTPGLFEGVDAEDEYGFMQTLHAGRKLHRHQKEFITEEDFAWMAANGVQAIRIPVGYWIFDGVKPYVSCIGRLDWAFRMAEKHGLRVLVSLHGAPGSQNGRDHSGRIGKAEWYRSAADRRLTVVSLRRLATRYRDSRAFWGLELLNEPRAGVVQWKLRRFYNAAYRELRQVLRPSTYIVFHDAFTPRLLSGAMWDDGVHPVAMDIHWYHFAFWARKWLPLRWYYALVVDAHGKLLGRLRRWQGVVVGEWNGIVTREILDKAPTVRHASIVKEHIDRQLIAYEQADAWFYWNYKTELRGVWHFRSLVEDGVIKLG